MNTFEKVVAQCVKMAELSAALRDRALWRNGYNCGRFFPEMFESELEATVPIKHLEQSP